MTAQLDLFITAQVERTARPKCDALNPVYEVDFNYDFKCVNCQTWLTFVSATKKAIVFYWRTNEL